MSLRFLLFISGEHGPRLSDLNLPEGMKEVSRTEKSVCFANDDVLVLPEKAGFVVGSLFRRSPTSGRITEMASKEANALIRTSGRTLTKDYWGAYVACLQTPEGDILVRDPSGAMPCVYGMRGGGAIAASDIDLLATGLGSRPQIDWDALFLHLVSGEFRRSRTALKGVSELLAGFRLRLSEDGVVESTWTPWDHISPRLETEAEAAVRIRSVVDEATEALGSCYQSIGVSLSGGLDSSIVTAALRGQANKLTLLNLSGEDPESDERAYARLAADAVGVPLTEAFYDLSDIQFGCSMSAFLPRPAYGGLARADVAIKQRMEAAKSIDAWFGGLGGDNVFCLMQSATPVLDRLRREGFSRGVLNTLNDVMALTGCSFWEALKQMNHTKRTFRGRYAILPQTSLLNSRTYDEAEITFEHPWLDPPPETPIGKVVHVAMLQRIQAATDGFPRTGAPLVLPLLSQPVMEACLSIPTWFWCVGGHNRSIARQAYEAVLPKKLVWRRSKGGPSRFAYRAVDTGRDQLRELLLGGLLAQHQFLDLTMIESHLRAGREIPASEYVRLTLLSEAEVWARHWS